jgi:hypothetical protein|tara:strand:- start:1041 stop:1370 length:330 start_codon:yes stop_codon:yes gene_type:complete
MSVIYELDKIREIIKRPCNMTKKVPFVIEKYSDVIDLWDAYKKNNLLNYNKILLDIFEFHYSDMDHIILFWSLNKRDCLLMCKIKNKYINITMPMLLQNKSYSFLATYT